MFKTDVRTHLQLRDVRLTPHAERYGPGPLAWTADADCILERLKGVRERTSDSGHERGRADAGYEPRPTDRTSGGFRGRYAGFRRRLDPRRGCGRGTGA